MITEEQKQQLDAMFRFKIGDVVRHVAAARIQEGRGWGAALGCDVGYVVLAQIACITPDEVTPQYRVREVNSNGCVANFLEDLFESELELVTPLKREE